MASDPQHDQKGYEFQVGPHTNSLRGYWACFIKSDERVVGWAECGHAMTAHRAVVMAAKVVLGKQVTVPGSETFEQ